MSRRTRFATVIFPRRFQAWIALFSCALLLVTTVGFPLPTFVSKDTSKPFPCQKRACGCRTAAECWDHCCCFSDEEKLAWAEANHVDPPASFMARMEAKRSKVVQVASSASKPSCCHSSDSCPSCGTTDQTKSCCACESTKKSNDQRVEAEVDYILVMEAARCQGTDLSWLCIKVTTLPPVSVIVKRPSITTIEWVTDNDELAESHELEPSNPPPEPFLY